MNWKPLDTAPKDGTRILLLTADFGAVEGWGFRCHTIKIGEDGQPSLTSS